MKKINWIIACILCIYLILMTAAGILLVEKENSGNREYQVEANRMMKGMEEAGAFCIPDLRGYDVIREVYFLEVEKLACKEDMELFLQNHNHRNAHIEALTVNGELLGLVRFDYVSVESNQQMVWVVEAILAISCLLLLTVLFYVKYRILRPFTILSGMPYELSKGRLDTEIAESKSRFFGKFVWGIGMLRDKLKSSQIHSFKLEREKKMLLLSISHDIKTPLNTIKLYARALEEGMYNTEEKQKEAAIQIEGLAVEIEDFVKEIAKTSSEDVVSIEVEKREFYLADLLKLIRDYYKPKCELIMTELTIESCENRLLVGNCDSAFEVIQNIMENAFKYGDGKSIHIDSYEEDYCQLLRIHNTGEAIRDEEMPHLFDSFFRGSNAGSHDGNGLGLYICREIMHRMDGDVFAEKSDRGMNFVIVFKIV